MRCSFENLSFVSSSLSRASFFHAGELFVDNLVLTEPAAAEVALTRRAKLGLEVPIEGNAVTWCSSKLWF